MKKMFSIALVVCMLAVALVPTNAFATADTVSAESDYLSFSMTASFENDELLTVYVETVCVCGETACTDIPYDCVSATLVYDKSVLTLKNAVLEEGELDCIAKLPDTTWENTSILCEDGVLLRACTTEGGASISNETPLVFVLQFELAQDADTVLFEIPDESVEVIDRNLDYRFGKGASLSVERPAPAAWGDANGDGAVNGLDAVALLRFLAEYDYATGTSPVKVTKGADLNGDGIIDGRDSIRLLRYLADQTPAL